MTPDIQLPVEFEPTIEYVQKKSQLDDLYSRIHDTYFLGQDTLPELPDNYNQTMLQINQLILQHGNLQDAYHKFVLSGLTESEAVLEMDDNSATLIRFLEGPRIYFLLDIDIGQPNAGIYIVTFQGYEGGEYYKLLTAVSLATDITEVGPGNPLGEFKVTTEQLATILERIRNLLAHPDE